MAFFSFILMFVVAGFVQINRSYTRGVTVKRTQDGARQVIEEIARVMRTSSSVTIKDDAVDHGNYRICFGGVRFGWNQYLAGSSPANFSNETYGSERINFIKSYDSRSCADSFASSPSDTVSSVLDENVQIQHLSINPVGDLGVTNAYRIKVVTSSIENSDIDPATYGENATCLVRVGDQYCDVSVLETVVTLRN